MRGSFRLLELVEGTASVVGDASDPRYRMLGVIDAHALVAIAQELNKSLFGEGGVCGEEKRKLISGSRRPWHSETRGRVFSRPRLAQNFHKRFVAGITRALSPRRLFLFLFCICFCIWRRYSNGFLPFRKRFILFLPLSIAANAVCRAIGNELSFVPIQHIPVLIDEAIFNEKESCFFGFGFRYS